MHAALHASVVYSDSSFLAMPPSRGGAMAGLARLAFGRACVHAGPASGTGLTAPYGAHFHHASSSSSSTISRVPASPHGLPFSLASSASPHLKLSGNSCCGSQR